jgi:hypothetical protein
MPSSFSFLLNSQSSSSSSSSENDSKSDQSDDDDHIGHYKKKTIQNANDMLERPSDHDDSCSPTDDTDNDEKENDLFTSSNNPRSHFLTRQLTFYDNDWQKKSSIDENEFQKSIHQDEQSLLEIERNDTFLSNSNPHRLVSMFFQMQISKNLDHFNCLMVFIEKSMTNKIYEHFNIKNATIR